MDNMDISNIYYDVAHEIWNALNEDGVRLTQEQKEFELFQRISEKIVEHKIESQLSNGKLSKEDLIQIIRDSNIMSSYLREELFNNQ